jgi:hypothetical protein
VTIVKQARHQGASHISANPGQQNPHPDIMTTPQRL